MTKEKTSKWCETQLQGMTWGRKLKLTVTAFLLLSLAGLTTACSKAPATGETIFTGGMTQEQEKSLGAQQHPQIVAAYGGAYEDKELNEYVTSLGNLLVATSELPSLDFTFTILDTPTVNAFALPGGYVYVTRGLLALANDEAELAGVMAHEIGHVTARHSAQRYGSNVLASVGQAALGAVLGGQAAQLGGAIAAPTLQSFSRQQEFEADTLGVRYLSRAGFDPEAMGTFLDHLQEKSRLEATLAGKPGAADTFDIMQTHPRTADRVDAAIRLAAKTTVANPMREQDIYFTEINGMVYGDSPKQGFIRGRQFSHPEMGFTFQVPKDYKLINASNQVVARHPEGSLIHFDAAPSPVHPDPLVYLRDQWRKNLEISGLTKITINGMPAATATARINRSNKPYDLRLLAIRFNDQQMFQFLFVTPPEQTASRSNELRKTSYSFNKLTPQQINALQPFRIDIRKADEKTRLASEAQNLPYLDHQAERLRVLNGMKSNQDFTAGQSYKMIVD